MVGQQEDEPSLLGARAAPDPTRVATGAAGHPVVAWGHSWLDKHPPLPPAASSSSASGAAWRRFALCLFGIPGVARGKAGELHTTSAALLAAASTHVEHVLRLAETTAAANGDGQSDHAAAVFAHAWNVSAKVDVPALLRIAYGPRLRSLRIEPLETRDRVLSMTRSIVRSLALARGAAAARGEPFDLLLLMRHDTHWSAPCDLRAAAPHLITIATWTETVVPCCLKLSRYDGVPDYWFAGGPLVLEFVFGSLWQRLERREDVHFEPRAHFVMQAHFDDLRLTARGLVRSHTGLFSAGSHCLYSRAAVSEHSRAAKSIVNYNCTPCRAGMRRKWHGEC